MLLSMSLSAQPTSRAGAGVGGGGKIQAKQVHVIAWVYLKVN